MAIEENRLRLTILGGFLGAGKSTWLRHQLFVNVYSYPHVIVNEVANHAVDQTLLEGARELDVLAGGCVCCDQKSEMLALLHRICNARSRNQTDHSTSRQLIFEMSGVADPAQVMATIQNDPILTRHIVLEEIIVVVDALHGLVQLQSEVLARRQIEAADRILVTKTDASTPMDIGILLATLRQINPGLALSASSFGVEIPMPDAAPSVSATLPDLDGVAGEPLTSMSLTLDAMDTENSGWVGFSVWLSAMLHIHGDHMVRVKGIVDTPRGRLLLQSVRKVMQAPETLTDGAANTTDNTIVLIGRGLDPERIRKSLKHFAAKANT